MQNENLKKLASGLSTKSNAKKDLELIADSQTAKICKSSAKSGLI
ncbi:hypothetical protein [Flavobacterium sasangense]|nr:hypothetical protein [Flavobacterium sasangense]